jgi:asparagine synthase (glutamine-hydrolysing)
VNAYSSLELGNYMKNTLLRDCDTMSMAHSLEVRVPFLDHVLAERVLATSGAVKLASGVNKPLLMALASGLPSEIGSRKKMGFMLPLSVWFRGALRPWIEGLLFDVAVPRLGGLEPDAVADHWRDFLAGGTTGSCYRIWCLAALAGWCEANGVTS